MFSSLSSLRVSTPRFLAEDGGAGLIEYALILSIISISAMLAMIFMRVQLMSLFSNIGNTVGQYPN